MTIKSNRIAVTGIALAITSLTLSSMVAAQDRGNRGKSVDRTAKQFERIDTNDDDVISLDELTVPAVAKAEKRFERKDADADGFLTFEEMTAGREEPLDLTDYIEEIAQCVADVKEETGNENITEIDPENYLSPQQKFDAADTSGDELLDLAEVQAKATSTAAEKFANMDSDENLAVSLEEFTAAKTSRQETRSVVKSCIDEVLDEGAI